MPLVLDGDTGIVGVLLTDANGNVTFDTNTLYVDLLIIELYWYDITK